MLSIGFSEEFCAGNVGAAVKGRLKSSVSYWASTLDAPQFTLDTISHGYRIPFASYPAPCFLSNNLSALRHPDFVVHAISELLDSGCIAEHSEPPFCVNPLTVPEGKTLRLLIDLRHVVTSFVLSLRARTFARCHRFFKKDTGSLPGTSNLDTTILICGTVTDSVLSLIWHILSLIWHVWSMNWHTLSLI